MITHALTIDLEDWHQIYHRRITGELISPSKDVITYTSRLLDVLDEVNIRATFFVLGYIAEAFPEIVREVARRGHEIGSHTYTHRLIYLLEPAQFRAEMERSRKQLQDLTGQPVLGFRAPEFSVSHLQHWCFDILVESGFSYDSSVFPIARARYGIPGAPRYPFTINTAHGSLHEFPLATWDRPRIRLPIAGGSYFRLLSARLLHRALSELDTEGCPAVLYFHPYEFHQGWIHLSNLTWRQRLQLAYLKSILLYNFRTDAILWRLRPLLTHFQFATLGEIYHHACVRT